MKEHPATHQAGLTMACAAYAPASDANAALNELFEQSMPRLYRAADSVLRNHHDSEDALQDGLLSALRHLDQFKGKSQFSTWLFSIVRNAALVKVRQRRAHPMLSTDDPESDTDAEVALMEARKPAITDPEREYAKIELSSRFMRTLEGLPPMYREIVLMCDVEGYSGREAAGQLGLTVSALKAQHHRARVALRHSMSPHGRRRRRQRAAASGSCFGSVS